MGDGKRRGECEWQFDRIFGFQLMKKYCYPDLVQAFGHS